MTNDISLANTQIILNDATTIAENTYITIDNESMYVDTKSGNELVVRRGQDGRLAAAHVSGAGVGRITSTDNDLIEIGDDFGFDGSFS